MNKTSVLVLLLAFASQFNSTEAFISAESIGNWFLNALTNAATSILNAIKDLATSIFNAIKDLALELINDVFHSLSSASSTFKDNANKLLNVGQEGKEHLPSSMEFLIGIMETGPMPPEWYFAKANPETEVNHLRYWISIIKWGFIIYMCLSMILIAWFGLIVARNRRLERRIIKMQ